MKVSVVIASYDSRDSLETCLASLDRQKIAAGDTLQVVVADDGSGDGTGDMVDGFGCGYELSRVFLPRGERSGRSAARNAGIRASTGELVVFIDADELVPPSFVAQHVRYHSVRDDLVVLGPRSYLAEGPFPASRFRDAPELGELPLQERTDARIRLLERFSQNLNNLATCWHYMYTCNASVRRKHLLAVGGFDESFRGWGLEDSELGYRLRRRGLAFAFNPDALLYHQPDEPRNVYQEWRSNLDIFTALHPEPEAAAQQIFLHAFDPNAPRLRWIECVTRFEYAVRALHGRYPRGGEPVALEVGPQDVSALFASLPELSARSDVLVVDDSCDPRVPPFVQCLDTRYELLYYRSPGAAERTQILSLAFNLAGHSSC